jgi:hypothetical protein
MNWKGDDSFCNLGEKIRATTQKDEVLFTYQLDLQPQMIYYAGRNIRFAHNEQEAIDFLQFRHLQKGFIIDNGKHITLPIPAKTL